MPTVKLEPTKMTKEQLVRFWRTNAFSRASAKRRCKALDYNWEEIQSMRLKANQITIRNKRK